MRISKEKIDSLSNRFKKRKYISILLALFTLGVNIFAWFAFSEQAQLELDASVASWDVEFKDENDQVISRNILVEITKMKPGMPDFNKTIEIESNSDVYANFSYVVDSVKILGQDLDLTNKGDVIQYLRNFYPFSIRMSSDKTTLSPTDSVSFSLDVVWPYDSQTPLYYGQDEIYSYNNTFAYYIKSGTNYTKASISSETVYNGLKSNLYVDKDDADTFFGMMCKEYETTSNKPCVVLNMRLIVEQATS